MTHTPRAMVWWIWRFYAEVDIWSVNKRHTWVWVQAPLGFFHLKMASSYGHPPVRYLVQPPFLLVKHANTIIPHESYIYIYIHCIYIYICIIYPMIHITPPFLMLKSPFLMSKSPVLYVFWWFAEIPSFVGETWAALCQAAQDAVAQALSVLKDGGSWDQRKWGYD